MTNNYLKQTINQLQIDQEQDIKQIKLYNKLAIELTRKTNERAQVMNILEKLYEDKHA